MRWDRFTTKAGEALRAAADAAERRGHPETTGEHLLLALGRIALMSEQWAKAREYLESSLRLAKSAEVYAELGRLCTAMGELERGNEYLLRSLPELPDLPLPHGG